MIDFASRCLQPPVTLAPVRLVRRGEGRVEGSVDGSERSTLPGDPLTLPLSPEAHDSSHLGASRESRVSVSESVSEFEFVFVFVFVFEGGWRERGACSETKIERPPDDGRSLTITSSMPFRGGSGGFPFLGDAIARRIPSGYGTLADRPGTALSRIPRDQHACLTPPSNTNSNTDTDSLTPSNTLLAHGFARCDES
jgi:hypothetical protein